MSETKNSAFPAPKSTPVAPFSSPRDTLSAPKTPAFAIIGHRIVFRRSSASARATFYYRAPDGRRFTEKVDFACPDPARVNQRVLARTLDLALFILGTSYYKSCPTTGIITKRHISPRLARLLNVVYQEGLSQFAFENNLTRESLAHFSPVGDQSYWRPLEYAGSGNLALQSGGKDSLLVATRLTEAKLPFRPVYVTSSAFYPTVLDQIGKPLTTIRRHLDLKNLKKARGLTGHVPITYIIESLALIQAVLFGYNQVFVGIGDEGLEPHARIGDLEIRHQWSKTASAENLLNEFIQHEISPNLQISSPLRGRSELEISQEFAQKCWDKYGHLFSSCNVANYRQGKNNQNLNWCAKCAKCANAYLLFAPFLPAAELITTVGGGRDLFRDPALVETFKGLLGVDGVMKPFECVGEIAELRRAYALRNPALGPLPFPVPQSDFKFTLLHPQARPPQQSPRQPFQQPPQSPPQQLPRTDSPSHPAAEEDPWKS